MKIDFKIFDEDDISWEIHNKIHVALNTAYSHRTASFHKKTYGLLQPIKRIILEVDDVIIAHTAIFETAVILNNEEINVAGIGLTLSLKPFFKLGYRMREQAVILCAELGYPLVLGRIKDTERNKKSLEPLVADFLPIPMIGKTTSSHEWETIAVYDTHVSADRLTRLVCDFKKEKKIILTTEVF